MGPQAVTGSFRQRVRFVPGVSLDRLACSHHLGHWAFGPVGNGDLQGPHPGAEAMQADLLADRDLPANVWWAEAKGGAGTGVHINDVMPIAPTPLSGGQAWFDCVCSVRKV